MPRASTPTIPVVHADFTAPGGWAATEELLARKVKFTGLFCANDQMAMAAISKLAAAGKSVPEDVSVVGYDNTDMGAYPLECAPHHRRHAPSGRIWALNCLPAAREAVLLQGPRPSPATFAPTFVPRWTSLRKIGR